MDTMKMLKDLQKATLEARARTNDKAISTQVGDGKVQVGRVVYKNSVGDFIPTSDWLTVEGAINELGRL
jgi:hypothetical protein